MGTEKTITIYSYSQNCCFAGQIAGYDGDELNGRALADHGHVFCSYTGTESAIIAEARHDFNTALATPNGMFKRRTAKAILVAFGRV